jgi:hypothetical protein
VSIPYGWNSQCEPCFRYVLKSSVKMWVMLYVSNGCPNRSGGVFKPPQETLQNQLIWAWLRLQGCKAWLRRSLRCLGCTVGYLSLQLCYIGVWWEECACKDVSVLRSKNCEQLVLDCSHGSFGILCIVVFVGIFRFAFEAS